jgi:hypothetical protein
MSSRANEALLFFVVDRGRAVAEIRTCAIAHLDEDGFAFMRHHEIDLADARAVVARNRTKSTLREESLSGAFRAAPQLRARRRLKGPR